MKPDFLSLGCALYRVAFYPPLPLSPPHPANSFDFCEPPRVSKIGIIESGDDEAQLQKMSIVFENLLHKFFKGKVPKLKDMAKEGMQKADERRAKKVRMLRLGRWVEVL